MIDYRAMLREEAEPEYAEFSSKLIPGKDGIMGVRIPKIRAIAKMIVKDDWESFLEDEPECFEEESLHAIVIASAPMDIERRIGLIDGFLGIIDNWSVCDTFCASLKIKKAERDVAYDYLASLMDTGKEFHMRVSLISRMDHFLDLDHVDDILSDIETYRNDGYYYKMGAAWAMSFCYVKFPEPSMRTLVAGKMDDWVFSKSIQKICESYRVSEGDKQKLKALKRNR